jgi:hypothetical protein
MRSDNNQLSLTRDGAMADPELAASYRKLAQWALTVGNTAHFTSKERRDYYLAEAAKYEPQKEEV